MNKIRCTKCSNEIPLRSPFYKKIQLSADLSFIPPSIESSFLTLHSVHCSNCGTFIIRASVKSLDISDSVPITPPSWARALPDYIPEDIREDYEEAYAISHVSPKASVALSRRCAQNIIRDFWKIKPDDFQKEIQKLNDIIPAPVIDALHALRLIGNKGAHSEKNSSIKIELTFDYAKALLDFLELLFDEWYISQHERNNCLNYIQKIRVDIENSIQLQQSNLDNQ